nr:capsid protein [Rat picobirnavirus]
MTIEYVNAQYSDGNISTGLVQAANQLYQFLRHKNSGAKNYEPADVITLVLAMREIYAEFGELRRPLGLARFFNLENRHLPQTLMKACGIDYEDLIANFANYRGKLNILATRINSIAVPNYFKAFERADLITNNVFMDSDSFRSQYYLYRKAGYYTWNSDGANGSELTFTARDMATTSTFGDRLEILAEMVNSVTTDTDANTIAGDVLFAFANSEIYQLAQISDDYLVVPYKDENILAQVENATFVTGYFPVNTTANDVLSRLADSMNVTQINGNLFWQPNFSATAAIARHALPTTKRLFNSHKEEPDYKDNLDWSRNIMYARITATGSSQTFFIQNCGLELCVAATIYTMNKKIAVATGLVSGDMTLYGAYVAQLLAQIEMFDWHPAVYVNLAPTGIYTCADIKKYTWLALDTIGATHDAANTAAFYSVQLFQESSR